MLCRCGLRDTQSCCPALSRSPCYCGPPWAWCCASLQHWQQASQVRPSTCKKLCSDLSDWTSCVDTKNLSRTKIVQGPLIFVCACHVRGNSIAQGEARVKQTSSLPPSNNNLLRNYPTRSIAFLFSQPQQCCHPPAASLKPRAKSRRHTQKTKQPQPQGRHQGCDWSENKFPAPHINKKK